SSTPSRVNARIDPATQQQLDELVELTNASVSHVVRESVAHYHAHVQAQQGAQRKPSRFLALAADGAWRSGRSDTASSVKAALAEVLDAKFAQHPPRHPPSTCPSASASASKSARRRKP
ncbi:MAG: hypothetical protein LH480_05610, partial [Rubrivivax sp.]|nr:hypothetical protein [Rubrivivax sp.]